MTSGQDLNAKVCKNGQLVRYSIYAWGSPLVFVILRLLLHFNNKQFRKYWIMVCISFGQTRFWVTTNRITGFWTHNTHFWDRCRQQNYNYDWKWNKSRLLILDLSLSDIWVPASLIVLSKIQPILHRCSMFSNVLWSTVIMYVRECKDSVSKFLVALPYLHFLRYQNPTVLISTKQENFDKTLHTNPPSWTWLGMSNTKKSWTKVEDTRTRWIRLYWK